MSRSATYANMNMPASARAQQNQFLEEGSSEESGLDGHADDEVEEELGEGEEEEEEDLDVHHEPTPTNQPPLPPHLREISSLASWTVSSSKPGCSIPQLRSPSTSLFWQSDGPQPHYLNIHFFKQVSIAGVRLFLDFDADESYTPTRILFLAGTGYNDLVQWAEMKLEQPRGWTDVDMSDVGRYEYLSDSDGEHNDDDDDEEPMHDADDDDVHNDSDSDDGAFPFSGRSASHSPPSHSPSRIPHNRHPAASRKPHRRRRRAPILRAHLLQVKILENHQNGKDTHLRGLQIFARDRTRRDRDDVQRVAVNTRISGGRASGASLAGVAGKGLAVRNRGGPMLGSLGDWGDGPDLR